MYILKFVFTINSKLNDEDPREIYIVMHEYIALSRYSRCVIECMLSTQE